MGTWRIETPSGYLRERTKGTKKQAEKWAKSHYSVSRVRKEPKAKKK